LFEDQKQSLSSLLTAQGLSKPVISINSSSEERHNVWAITEPRVIREIYALFSEKPLYIADGHHRYESALIYQREQHTLSSTASGDEDFNFVMMTLVDFADPGLVILPPYRLLRGLSPPKIANLMTKLQSLFDVEELPLDMPGVWRLVDDLLLKANQTRLVLCGLAAEKLLVLTLRDSNTAKKMMPYFHSELYKELDVSIVDHVILEELLGLSGSEDEAKISYNYDIKDTVNRVLAQEYQLAFILRPIKAEVIKAVADAGDRMPRKSTYFYPKLPSGLVLNRLV
jgi:uncharacterized protein (DUF1015 family)